MQSAVAKSFAVLEALSSAHGATRLSALATGLGLQKSTVHRILTELVALGYVEQDEPTGLYRPSLRTWEIGTTVVADLPIKQAAAGALHDLHRRTAETVSLTVRAGDDVLYLDKIVSPRPTRFTTRVGSRIAAPLTAGGQAMLAHSTDADEVVARVVGRPDVPSDFDGDAALRRIADASRRGYAVSSARRGTVSIAAAILDRLGRPVGALSVSAPTTRVRDAGRSAIADAVVTATSQLAESIGRLSA